MYLDGVIARSQATLRFMVQAMGMTQTTDVQYFIQQSAPIVLHQLDRAQALRGAL